MRSEIENVLIASSLARAVARIPDAETTNELHEAVRDVSIMLEDLDADDLRLVAITLAQLVVMLSDHLHGLDEESTAFLERMLNNARQAVAKGGRDE